MSEADTVDQVEADQARAPSAEEAADLASLERMAAAADPVAPGAPRAAAPADQVAPPSQQAMMFAGMLMQALRPLASWALPVLKDAPAELWEPTIEGTAALFDHYGVGGAQFASTPWGRFAFGMLPLAGFVAVQSITAPPPAAPPARIGGPDLAAPAAPADGGQRTVIIGAPVPA